MSARRTTAGRRLLGTVVDVVNDRAPRLADRAYRVVATPLHWVDPAGGARTADARLDEVRDRLAAMAANGQAPGDEQRRIRRDLARTQEDLDRLTSRLPAVQARALTRRLSAYSALVAALPGETTATRARRSRTRDALAFTGVAGAAGMGLLLPAAEALMVEGAVVGGVATALGVTVARRRRARQERSEAWTRALAVVEQATKVSGGVPAPDLDRRRHSLIRRGQVSGRLDQRGASTLRLIDEHLDDLLVRLVDGALDVDAAYLVTATITRYLPDTLEPFLALTTPHADVAGRPAAAEVADQFASIESALSAARRRPAPSSPEARLLLQRDFLRDKFGAASEEGPR